MANLSWEKDLERTLVQSCAPTLAGLKSGSLFRCNCCGEKVYALVNKWKCQLVSKGLNFMILRNGPSDSLIYAYRIKQLKKDLSRPDISYFLHCNGYQECHCLNDYLKQLSSKITKNPCFPHEIGLFLGYPLHDVEGFIRNKGQNFCCAGCWKVYANPEEAQRCFMRYKKCQRLYTQKHDQGRSVFHLTISA